MAAAISKSKHILKGDSGVLSSFGDLENISKSSIEVGEESVILLEGEFWTAKQRQASALHEVSYRACFKPQLPAFFIRRFSSVGDIVYDPFGGRGTTAIEASLLGRVPYSNDINPLSKILANPRVCPPSLGDIASRLDTINFDYSKKSDIDLSMFYHHQTEAELVCLREYLDLKANNDSEDLVDAWIRMVATNRLTGHSKGFFSVYSLPPNQAASQQSQKKINLRLKQEPEYRDTKAIILHKSKQLLGSLASNELENLKTYGSRALFSVEDARHTSSIKEKSVQLIITSPPFLDVVQYARDNWLRCWFNKIDLESVASKISITRKVVAWEEVMQQAFYEFYRITKKGAVVVFEVGEVKKGKVRLEEHVVPLGIKAGFKCEAIIINSQSFTKTSNIWGVKNNTVGTNSNRIVVFSKID